MRYSKPLHILRQLTVIELRRFNEFLHSPLHNKSEKVTESFEFIRKFHPEYDHQKLERKLLFIQLFKGEDYDEKKLRYLLTDLAKLLEEFLSMEEYRRDTFYQQKQLLKSYDDRGLDKYYEATFRRLRKAQKKQSYRNSDFLWKEFELEENFFQYISSRKDHQVQTNLQQVVNMMDFQFLANKLKYSCEILNNRSVVKVDYELLLLDEILDYLDKRDLSRYPAIEVYYQILLTLREPNEHEHYSKLVQVLNEHYKTFPDSEVFDMYVYAKNYCIIKINQGQTEFYHRLFEFYQDILANRVIFKDGHLTEWDYKNIVTLSCRIGEFDWVEKFMNEYKGDLGEDYRENSWRYNRANLEFFKKNYDQTLSLLREVDFTDVYYHLDSKSLLMKTYFELEELESLQSLMEAFKVYLKRNQKIPENHSLAYANQIYFINKLVRHKRSKKVELKEVAEEVAQTPLIADKGWLLAKLSEVMSGEN